ncbi:lysine methyltransferase Set8 [Schizosaccharomyces cryophilus OY26]|uniref:Lysine methyltransferase Set8 n=1 Tax=Schizosaccharomyces cryophilus (strain OY26 / ATCC MYA-4695 / CBS 11777 / NBRC 106824 / NRRL Y48691) TaxID=653667 RepID=S9XD24_SCHCR|nr:lysine methyltransferase Set8 [Schizosaccharomyces cryophilus OY26]EPY51736.1 lysine methyltransferase Set8 [Schizosaccharomyces cryophilus OY26]
MHPSSNELINAFVKKCIKLEIAEIEGKGRGLRCLEKCDSGQLLLEIPLVKVICEESITEYRKKNKSFASIAESEEWDVMPSRKQVLFILCHLNGSNEKESEWNLYLSTLPSYIDTPVQWPESDIQGLQGTSLFMPVLAKQNFLREEWEELRTRYGNLWPGKITLSDWIHADALYNSRCLERPSGNTVLSPVIDLCNHSNSANSRWDFTSDAIQVYAQKTISVGDEITFNYGSSKGAGEFLFSYGFIPQSIGDGTIDVVKILIPKDPNDPLDVVKRSCCKRPPMIEFASDPTGLWWHAPFLYFSILNIQDFTFFHLEQNEYGDIEPQWEFEGQRTTIEELPKLILKSSLKDLYFLRVFCLVEQLAEAALKHNLESDQYISSRKGVATNLLLRERNLFTKILPYLKGFIEDYAKSEVVSNYLATQDAEQ